MIFLPHVVQGEHSHIVDPPVCVWPFGCLGHQKQSTCVCVCARPIDSASGCNQTHRLTISRKAGLCSNEAAAKPRTRSEMPMI